jgi:hypothetical protein
MMPMRSRPPTTPPMMGARGVVWVAVWPKELYVVPPVEAVEAVDVDPPAMA